MPYRRNYPRTAREVLGEMKFKRDAIRTMREFKESHPWRGNLNERYRKFDRLLTKLSRIYHIEKPILEMKGMNGGSMGSTLSYYSPTTHTITMVGKLSVITFLHEFAHARGFGERYACKWSLNLFRKIFPIRFRRLRGEGHVMVLQKRKYTNVKSHKKKSEKGRIFKVKKHKRRLGG